MSVPGYYRIPMILKSKYELNTSIMPTKITASSVVPLLFTNSPINFLSLVAITRGIIGMGIMMLKTT